MTSHDGISLCVFGSAARESMDGLSDKDILLVCDCPSKRAAMRERWKNNGWSVASYTRSRVRAMIKKGSLFIQHLKREGLIVRDDGDWLSGALHAARPRPSYEDDLAKSIEMIYPIDRLGEDYWSQLLAADLAYVFVRNASIYLLADNGQYEFCYHRLVDQIGELRSLESAEIELLHGLRESKFAYRDRFVRSTIRASVEEIRSICAKVHPAYIHAAVETGESVRLFDVRYATLRDVEAKLVATGNTPVVECQESASALKEIWQMVAQPRDYSWTIRQIDRSWVSRVDSAIESSRRPTSSSIVSSAKDLPETKLGWSS